jgi:2-methylcitrate dehydratase PrpD
MAWQSDPSENARPFQMGMAARNGITAALLAARGFGGPIGVFDQGHTVFKAFSRAPRPELLTAHLGERWDGIAKLAIKPYPCVSFLHPALDALFALSEEHDVRPGRLQEIVLRFARSGVHCVDGNPLKSHCAQYVLPTALVRGRLEVAICSPTGARVIRRSARSASGSGSSRTTASWRRASPIATRPRSSCARHPGQPCAGATTSPGAIRRRP